MMMVVALCTHLDHIRVSAPEEVVGCEQCLQVDEVAFVVESDQLGSGG